LKDGTLIEVQHGSENKKTKKDKGSRLTEELLQTARDMQASSLMTKAAHDKITMRHVGVVSAVTVTQARKSRPRAGGGSLVCLAGAFPQAKTARGGQKSCTVTRPGSSTPLVCNITVFVLQYAVAVATAMKLEPHAAVAIIGHAVSGASAGYFSGFAVALLRRYRNFDAGKNSGARATEGA
jgi:hypothetical protein